MTAVAHAYRYARPSALSQDAQPQLTLATSSPQGADNRHPHFFEGRLLQPRLCAQLLSAVHLVVGARFYTPANSVARAIQLADPVVTADGQKLRFEGFSSCCSCYVRADLLPNSYSGEVIGKGTTNVDFNAPMRAALARLRDTDGLGLSVGSAGLTLHTAGNEVVERKVDLPRRWLRGMVEVQACQAGMRRCFTLKGLDALRMVRSLPKASTSRTPLWIVPSPGGAFTTTRAHAQGVRVSDTTRLRVLEALLPKATSLTVYADEAQQTSAWVLDFPGARLSLVLSAQTWRGFSGEGQALSALMRMADNPAVAPVKAQLAWQTLLKTQDLATRLTLPVSDIEDSLHILGASGLVGFDLAEGGYFHRVLPFDLSSLEDLQPRLAGARQLVAEGSVRVLQREPVDARVSSGSTEYSVRGSEDDLHCTCPWYAKHQGERGPCKHVLAVLASVN